MNNTINNKLITSNRWDQQKHISIFHLFWFMKKVKQRETLLHYKLATKDSFPYNIFLYCKRTGNKNHIIVWRWKYMLILDISFAGIRSGLIWNTETIIFCPTNDNNFSLSPLYFGPCEFDYLIFVFKKEYFPSFKYNHSALRLIPLGIGVSFSLMRFTVCVCMSECVCVTHAPIALTQREIKCFCSRQLSNCRAPSRRPMCFGTFNEKPLTSVHLFMFSIIVLFHLSSYGKTYFFYFQ